MKKFNHFRIKNELQTTLYFSFKILKTLANNIVHYLNIILYIRIIFFLDNTT
jgi:hypothetical protein